MMLVVCLKIPCGKEHAIHPAWIHAELRRSVCATAHERALGWWATLCPPEIHLIHAESGSGTRALTSTRAHELRFVWDAGDGERHVAALRDLAERYTRWQRGREGVGVSVSSGAASTEECDRWLPSEDGEEQVWVASPGFGAVDGEWRSGAVTSRYRIAEKAAGIARSGYGTMLPFAFPEEAAVDPEECGQLSDLFRRAVMSVVPDPLPAELVGHGANGRPHVAFVPLIDAGWYGATGEMWGVGVVFPRAAGEWVADVTDVLVSRELQLRSSQGKHALWHAPNHPLLGSMTTSARTWATVTPLVLDRFSGRGREAAEIARGCGLLGLPEVDRIIPSRGPLVPGGVSLRRGGLARADRRPFTHVELEFSEPVRGPVLLGAQRHLGMGVCVPLG